MKISFHRIYSNSTFIITVFGVTLGFILYARSFGGYEFDRQKFGNFCDVALSCGTFLVGIPLLMDLLFKHNPVGSIGASIFQKVSMVFKLFGVVAAVIFIFGFENEGYVGFVQLPENGKTVFLAALFSSALSALFHVLQSFMGNRREKSVDELFPILLVTSSLGLGFCLLVLQIFSAFFSMEDVYEATVPLYEFFRQLLVVSAVSTYLIRLARDYYSSLEKFIFFANVIGSLFLLIGFQSLGFFESSNEVLYIISQGSTVIGLSLLSWLGVFLIFKTWKKLGYKVIDSGYWVSHLVFLMVLCLTILTQVGIGKQVLSMGILDNLRFALLIFATPLLASRSQDHQPLYSSVNGSFFWTLTWCGICIVAVAVLFIAPAGGTTSLMGQAAFKPLLGVALSGLFMLAAGCAILIWDKVLGEFI